VDPDGDEDPLAMVEFVFPINVQHKLKGYLPKLSNPLDLLRSSEALTTHREIRGLQRDDEHATRRRGYYTPVGGK
jgi:hypothetical protein